MIRHLVFSAAILCASTAHAGIIETIVGGSDGRTPYEGRQVDQHAGPGSSARSQIVGSGLSAVAAGATASLGVLKSAATLGTANPLGGGTSWATSRWEDTLRMNNASLIGQRATATFTFAQSYMLDTVSYENGWQIQSTMAHNVFIGASSATYVDVLTNWGTGFDQERTLSTSDARGRTLTSPPNMRFIDLVVDFVWGEELRIGSQLQASCVIGWRASPLYGGCTADAAHSSYWGGISSIVDASGHEITGYTLTSGSGMDYSQSMVPVENDVPEPATLPIIILGGLALAISLRKRTRPSLPSSWLLATPSGRFERGGKRFERERPSTSVNRYV